MLSVNGRRLNKRGMLRRNLGAVKTSPSGKFDLAIYTIFKIYPTYCIGESLACEVIGKIRHCLDTKLVLGKDRFREQVSELRG